MVRFYMLRKYEPIEIGQRFNKLVAIGEREPSRYAVRSWRCDCGTFIEARDHAVRTGGTKSCGCLQRQRAAASLRATRLRHGMSNTPEYRAWAKMLARCNNPNDGSWRNYGARGIAVAPEWGTFDRFFADMGSRPSANHSLDRVDNEAPYSAANCRWATREQQVRNRRVSLTFDADGCPASLTEIAAAHGLKYHTLYNRIRREGLTLEQALAKPSRRSPRR